MTAPRLAKARKNAVTGGYRNATFRRGEIEPLPVAGPSVDGVGAHAVRHLAPEKGRVDRAAFRLLRPGGRSAISDGVATRPISPREWADPTRWSSCGSGAREVPAALSLLGRGGFHDFRVDLRSTGTAFGFLGDPDSHGIVSADVRATEPRGG